MHKSFVCNVRMYACTYVCVCAYIRGYMRVYLRNYMNRVNSHKPEVTHYGRISMSWQGIQYLGSVFEYILHDLTYSLIIGFSESAFFYYFLNVH